MKFSSTWNLSKIVILDWWLGNKCIGFINDF